MISIGSANGLTKVTAYLKGLEDNTPIPITSFNCSYSIGSIPTCSLGVPIEFISKLPKRADDKTYEVIVESNGNEYVLFTGYVAGPSGTVSGRSAEAGVNLVHPARDLDATRTSNPDLLTSGVNDWDFSLSSSGDGNANEYYFYDDDTSDIPLPKQIINGMINTLKESSGSSLSIETESINYDKSIDLLNKIKVLNGTLNEETGGIFKETINQFVEKEFNGSVNSQTSLWNTLNSVMSQFGFQLICNHKGEVLITADLANFIPPDINYFYSNQIWSLNQSSFFVRNVSQVNLLLNNQNTNTNTDNQILVSYPKEPPADQSFSGSMIIILPEWLERLNTPNEVGPDSEPASPSYPPPELPTPKDTEEKTFSEKDSQEKYAKSIYYLEKNKWSTISFSGPLLPKAVPGTTVWVQPYSSVKAMSGDEIGDGSLFSGHLVEVSHSLSASGMSVQTSLVLKNVSRSDEDANIKEHFLFSDVTAFVLE